MDEQVEAGFVRELGASPAEFERGLYLALPGGVSSPAPLVYRADDGEAVLEVVLTAMPDRRIGQFCIPVTRARLRFLAGDAQACDRLLSRLDRAMQRGGG
ncbi:hypothetical protein [Zoogloea sp.]|uniref:hypothetical protein n=1 Tax=Zoogloea sp. TaxID=49181 RepID=UPI0014169C01|nr:MAG: hypothetical protein F9K15_19415 [Zoogloea sp.]